MPDCCGLRTAQGGDEKVATAHSNVNMEEGEEREGGDSGWMLLGSFPSPPGDLPMFTA